MDDRTATRTINREAIQQRPALARVIGSGSPIQSFLNGFFPWRMFDGPVRRVPVQSRPAQAQAPKQSILLGGEGPFVAGTGSLGGLVPPIASAQLREFAGHDSVAGYMLASDTWSLLVSRFLKERSTILELGCGCGDVARLLSYHPWVARYVGLDSEAPNIDWCLAAIAARSPEKFEFALVDSGSGQGLPPSIGEAAVDLVFARRFPCEGGDEEVRSALADVRRVLCRNGLFLAAIPADSHPIGPDRFERLAEEAGLELYQRMGLLGDQELYLFVQGGLTRQDAEDSGRKLTAEMQRLNTLAAAEHEVPETVHPDDFIYWFCATHPHLSLEAGIHYYFRDGGNSARKLMDLIAGFDDLDLNSVKLLEFASGYGCVTRHLRKRSQLDLVSCDIHPQALDFLGRTLGVKTLVSAHHPEGFAPPGKYDVIFALSFFSHMPPRSFGPWLRALFHALHDPGYLVFTTLGLKACASFGVEPEALATDGIWFEARSEQHDLDEAEYGMTLATPEYVRSQVERYTGASVALFKHVGWWDNQDLWVVKRDS